MARRVFTRLVDDIDGTSSEDIGTVSFGLDGKSYEIDLTTGNAEKLRGRLAGFIAHAKVIRERPQRRPTAAPGRRKAHGEQMKAIRQWARSNGHHLADRGRMPAYIVQEFNRAHADTPDREAPG